MEEGTSISLLKMPEHRIEKLMALTTNLMRAENDKVLGRNFLRHLRRTRLLVHVVDAAAQRDQEVEFIHIHDTH
ncbi:hypothetical protein RJ641_028944 [Dillenia turbinata]|uniref:Uncharacterized protein n=1 Tax=Dillenia turbinata TaxID=194707 RepID=A0AAN8VQP7_9MAGN